MTSPLRSSSGHSLWHPFSNPSRPTGKIIAGASGSTVRDECGRSYLDATGALWFCNVGFGRNSIADAAYRQMLELPTYHSFGPYTTTVTIEAADAIAALSPMPNSKVFFTSGGSDAVETAVKLARRYWSVLGRADKRVIVSREFAYHGMNAYGTSLGGIAANQDGYGGALVEDVAQVGRNDVAAVAELFERSGGSIAAFIGEPVIGAGGVHAPQEGYWPAIGELCRRHDVLLIADEVISGFGRMGDWFASERFGLTPDLVTFAKGVTSGYQPLGGVLIGERVSAPFIEGDGAYFRHGYTYSGHATACAAALENLRILDADRLAERALEMEPKLADLVAPLASLDLVSETRSVGMAAAIEISEDVRAADPSVVDRIVEAAWEHGVLTRPVRGVALQISPALTVSDSELGAMVAGIAAAIEGIDVAAG